MKIVWLIFYAIQLAQEGESGTKTDRIIGGEDALEGEFPFIVRIGSFCAGSIISPLTILTAAHCAEHPGLHIGITQVIAGDHDISKPSKYEVYRTVDDFVVHPEFDMDSMIHDIALIFLDEPLSLGQSTMIVAVQLPMSEVTYGDGSRFIAIGWGNTMKPPRELYPDVLQKVTVDFIPDDKCRKMYHRETILEQHLCAAAKGKDACQGDSGGPLLLADDPSIVVGITSYGYGCAEERFPGIYAEVRHYMEWIKSNMRE